MFILSQIILGTNWLNLESNFFHLILNSLTMLLNVIFDSFIELYTVVNELALH